MLVPADWLTQDPHFQPDCSLPLGWCPPVCTKDKGCPPAEPPDDAMRDVMDPAVAAILQVRQYSLQTLRRHILTTPLTAQYQGGKQAHAQISGAA